MRTIILCISLFSTTVLRSQDNSIVLPTKDAKQPQEAVFIDTLDLMPTGEHNFSSSYTVRSLAGNQVFLRSYSGINQNLMDYLTSSHVQQQIELSSDQKEQLSELRKRFAEGMQKITNRFPALNNPKMPKAMRDKLNENYSVEIKALRKNFEEQVEESLVPQQLKLIKQLKFNTSVRMYGLSHTLTQKPFIEDTKVTPQQSQEIQKIKLETEAAIQKKVAEMRAAAKQKMLKVLDSAQRKSVKELEGKSKSKPLLKL